MVQMDLELEEAKVMHEILEQYLDELLKEIARTDTELFREKLRKRRQIVEKMLEHLSVVSA